MWLRFGFKRQKGDLVGWKVAVHELHYLKIPLTIALAYIPQFSDVLCQL